MPGPPPEVTTKRCFFEGMDSGPIGEQAGEAAGVFIVARHLDRCHGALALQIGGFACGDFKRLGGLLLDGSGTRGAGVVEQLECVVGLFPSAKARGAEEDHGVLNLLAAKTRKWLEVFRDDADQAAIGAIEEGGVLVGQRRDAKRRRHVAGKCGGRRGLRCRLRIYRLRRRRRGVLLASAFLGA